MTNNIIQNKWKEGLALGYDCIAFGDGTVTLANLICSKDADTNKKVIRWFPLCDTNVEGILKYDDDIWTRIDFHNGSLTHNNKSIVFGDGAMGNEGFVAMLNKDGSLKWSIFFSFSNPICKVEVSENTLICYGDSGIIINIDLNDITSIKVDCSKWGNHPDDF